VLTRGTFSVVVVTDHNPFNTAIAIVRSSLRDSTPFPGDLVLDLVRLVVLDVYGANQSVLRDVLEVTTVLKPGSTSGDVVGGALALNLDQNWEILGCLSVPWFERLQEL